MAKKGKGRDFYGQEVTTLIEEACREFSVSQEELDIEVLETGSAGIFGLCRKKAHIRVRPKERSVAPVAEKQVKDVPAPVPEKSARDEGAKEAEPADREKNKTDRKPVPKKSSAKKKKDTASSNGEEKKKCGKRGAETISGTCRAAIG